MNVKLLKIIVTLTLILIYKLMLAQTIYNYVLDNSNIHVSPVPAQVGGIHPPTDYNPISKPLVAEPFADNIQVGINGGVIHPDAGDTMNVFFGGDSTTILEGSMAVPIYTNQSFSSSDFPIYMESNFYSEADIQPYNESYLFIIPSNYQYFSSPTYNFDFNSLPKEGVVVGGRPYQSWVNINFNVNQPSSLIQQTTHNLASNGSWFNFKIVLDLLNGSLIVRDVKVDDQCVYNSPVNIGTFGWLNDFRLGLAVDDLAHDFTIITNYSSMLTDFSMIDSICEGDCISIVNQSSTELCNVNNDFQWSFSGADINTSNLENPTDICFQTSGTFPISLIVTNEFETDTVTKLITVVPSLGVGLELDLELGNDTSICDAQTYTLETSIPNGAYLWSDNSTSSTLTVSSSGLYWVEATSGCSFGMDTIEITFGEIPDVYIGEDTIICENNTVYLDAFHPDAISYSWQDGSTNSSFDVSQTGNYAVTITNADNCSSLESINITVDDFLCNPCPIFGFPNAFTPDGDQINDSFFVLSNGAFEITDFKIYNRWGNIIHNSPVPWNGTYKGEPLPSDLYIYTLALKTECELKQFKGEIILIR